VTLVDTSAWVEFLRGTGTAVHHRVRDLLASGEALHTTDVIVMELLAGGRDEGHAARLRRLLARCRFEPVAGLGDFEAAAELYRRCRQGGSTVRSLTDCLIAAVALRADLPVLHADRDFDALARHSDLRLASLDDDTDFVRAAAARQLRREPP
jgi:predicted nucleic acid-binding protein